MASFEGVNLDLNDILVLMGVDWRPTGQKDILRARHADGRKILCGKILHFTEKTG